VEKEEKTVMLIQIRKMHRTNIFYVANGLADLADGDRWERLTKTYLVFNFEFEIHIANIEKTLNLFRTPFWLRGKMLVRGV
jgi:hypothetical protein